MSPKKERGKQRKAAKSLAAVNGVNNIPKTVALLRKGDYKTTMLLGDGSLEEFNGISYEQSGILSTTLRFLKRCEDDTFVKVMLDVGGGNLTSPQNWVRILMKAEAQEPNSKLHIAENIGPLVRCMCNDTKRQFFKSNKHWREGLSAFVCLIHNILRNCVDEIIIGTLLQYEGLLTSIIQWAFWDEEYRPDITKEIVTEDCKKIVELGVSTVKRLIKAADTQTEKGRERLETIGTTPIINKEYDSECKISFVVGLLRRTKIEGLTIDVSACLRRLLCDTVCSCVDKDVIAELIDLGINTSDDRWVVHVAVLLRYMMLKVNTTNNLFYSDDTRVAFAIRSGLVELCLTFIERFGSLESFDKKKDSLSSLFFTIKMILYNIHWIGLHKKTVKAIRSKRCSIEQELARLEQNTITNIVKCKKLIEMTRSILDINGSYCCRCNKALSTTEAKLCNGCGCMAYCSRACQKEDWSDGHKLTCGKKYTDATAGQFQGRYEPISIPVDERDASKLKELEINMSMIQLKLFLGNAESILTQAEGLELPLCDCVVEFDLRKCPPVVKTQRYTKEFSTPFLKKGFEDSRSKKNILCIFISNIYDGNLVGGRTPTLEMQRLFPCEWLSKQQQKRDTRERRD